VLRLRSGGGTGARDLRDGHRAIGGGTIEDVIVHCFRGEATPAEVSHAIAVRRSSGDLRFEQTDDPYQWVLPTGKLELVHIDGIYVATVQFTGSRWAIIDTD
jgi:hypothetical protein